MTASFLEIVLEFTMLSVTVLAAAYFTAAYATPILSGLGDLPSPEPLLPTSENIIADTFQSSPGQSPGPDPQPFYTGDQVLPGSGTGTVTDANVDIIDNPEKSANQVAIAALSVSDTDVNLIDASNTDHSKLSTSLDLPSLSPASRVPGESKPFPATSAGDASGSEDPCVDSGSGSPNKVRRNDLFDWIKDNLGLNSCPATYDEKVPDLKPKPDRPQIPGQTNKPKPYVDPKIRKHPPNPDLDPWYNPRVNGGSGLGGEASCTGRMSDVDKPHTVVCNGRVFWTGSIAEEVHGCQRCTYLYQSARTPFFSAAFRKKDLSLDQIQLRKWMGT